MCELRDGMCRKKRKKEEKKQIWLHGILFKCISACCVYMNSHCNAQLICATILFAFSISLEGWLKEIRKLLSSSGFLVLPLNFTVFAIPAPGIIELASLLTLNESLAQSLARTSGHRAWKQASYHWNIITYSGNSKSLTRVQPFKSIFIGAIHMS